MTILLHNHPQDVTQEEFEKDLLLLPDWRQKKALRFRFLLDRVLCAKAYLLQKQGLSSTFGITENPWLRIYYLHLSVKILVKEAQPLDGTYKLLYVVPRCRIPAEAKTEQNLCRHERHIGVFHRIASVATHGVCNQ